MHEMIDLLGEYDDCYVETSFVRYRDLLERALLEHPDRVLRERRTVLSPGRRADGDSDSRRLRGQTLAGVLENACRVVDALAPESELRQ